MHQRDLNMWQSHIKGSRPCNLLISSYGASHVILGRYVHQLCSVLAYTDNQFDAYRIRDAVSKDGGTDVQVFPVDDDTMKKISEAIEESFFQKTR